MLKKILNKPPQFIAKYTVLYILSNRVYILFLQKIQLKILPLQ